MNMKTIKIVLMAGFAMLMGQTQALASPTQVVFRVPVHASSNTLLNRAQVICKISHAGLETGSGARPISGYHVDVTLNVTVTANPGKTFQKGDAWQCYINPAPAVSPTLDNAHSTREVRGNL